MEQIIFVVDDNGTNLAATKAVLGDAYIVYTMSSGEKCLNLLDKVTPHLILLDIDMPEMDGFEVLAAIKAHPVHHAIPVIFLTAITDKTFEYKGRDMGAIDFIRKPFSALSFLARVKAHLG